MGLRGTRNGVAVHEQPRHIENRSMFGLLTPQRERGRNGVSDTEFRVGTYPTLLDKRSVTSSSSAMGESAERRL